MTLRKKKPKRDSGTRSRVKNPRAPPRDEKHLALVRNEYCAICGQWPSEAHHVRAFRQRTMGVRPSDYLAICLCSAHHRELHKGNEAAFWKRNDYDPLAWIRNFSEEGRKAIEELRKESK